MGTKSDSNILDALSAFITGAATSLPVPVRRGTAALGAGYDKLQGALGNRGDMDYGDLYSGRLSAMERNDDRLQDEHPLAALAGGVATGAATAPFLGTGVGSMAAYGAANAASNTRNHWDDDTLAAAKDTALGGGIGAAIGKLNNAMASKAAEIGSDEAAKSIGSNKAKDIASNLKFFSKPAETSMDNAADHIGDELGAAMTQYENAEKVRRSSLDDIMKMTDSSKYDRGKVNELSGKSYLDDSIQSQFAKKKADDSFEKLASALDEYHSVRDVKYPQKEDALVRSLGEGKRNLSLMKKNNENAVNQLLNSLLYERNSKVDALTDLNKKFSTGASVGALNAANSEATKKSK